ncbi:MAG TPA: ATP-binding protein, partial [Chloroflexota bacterium]|nr:ATP-binding protein [Chloroflexota bacterium]
HELRTPLTAIIGFTEMLQHYWERMPEARRRQQVGHIAQAAGRQQRLVEDLLLLRQAEDGPLIVETQVLPIEPLIQEAVAELQGRYKDQRVSLDGPYDLEVRADPHQVRQILVSLLDNAAKYSPNQGLIEVSWGRQGTEIEVRVRDHGPGVPNDERDRLFTRFGRLAGSKIRSGRVGIGLGLYLGRRLVRAMGGELDLLDSGPMGSTFRIQIPAPPWEDV